MLAGIELVIALLAVFVAATVMGTVGFGFGLVAAPVILLFLEPQSGVIVVNGVITILTASVVVRTRQHLELKPVWLMCAGGAAAVPIGVFVLANADAGALRIAIGVIILVLGFITLFNIQLPMVKSAATGGVVGFLTSLSITTLSIGGPLVAIYAVAQQWPPQKIRTTLAFYFVLSYVIGFVFYAWAGLLNRETLVNIGILIPAMVAGLALASVLARRINQRIFRYAVAAVVISGSVLLLSRELLLR